MGSFADFMGRKKEMLLGSDFEMRVKTSAE